MKGTADVLAWRERISRQVCSVFDEEMDVPIQCHMLSLMFSTTTRSTPWLISSAKEHAASARRLMPGSVARCEL